MTTDVDGMVRPFDPADFWFQLESEDVHGRTWVPCEDDTPSWISDEWRLEERSFIGRTLRVVCNGKIIYDAGMPETAAEGRVLFRLLGIEDPLSPCPSLDAEIELDRELILTDSILKAINKIAHMHNGAPPWRYGLPLGKGLARRQLRRILQPHLK